MNQRGLAGCGCLVFFLIIIMVLTGALFHPATLRFIGNQFRYEDRIFTSDALFVPRFPKDKTGELYIEAFRQYAAGNGRLIIVEDDAILGTTVAELVSRMARTRNVKEDGVRRVAVAGQGLVKNQGIKEQIERQGLRKVIVIVPDYASRRYHLMYNSTKGEGKVLYLIKAVPLTVFKADQWWRDSASRGTLVDEAFAIGLYYLQRFKYGESEQKNSKR